MIVAGRIRHMNIEKKIFTMLVKRRVVSFYLQNNLFKKFHNYLYVGRFVHFVYDEKQRIVDKKKVYTVKHFKKISTVDSTRGGIVFYDIETIRQGIKEFLENMDNKMFLDFEMTMIDRNSSKFFKSEIIQAGIVIADNDQNVLFEKQIQIKPTKFKWINKRTLNFAKITKDDLDSAIPYKDFYTEFKKIIEKYNPVVIVWGRNDILVLNDSYMINKVRPIPIVFSNLMQIQKNYFNLKNDPGLFNTHKLFTNEDLTQQHSSLHDAKITMSVFKEFKKITNGKREKPIL